MGKFALGLLIVIGFVGSCSVMAYKEGAPARLALAEAKAADLEAARKAREADRAAKKAELAQWRKDNPEKYAAAQLAAAKAIELERARAEARAEEKRKERLAKKAAEAEKRRLADAEATRKAALARAEKRREMDAMNARVTDAPTDTRNNPEDLYYNETVLPAIEVATRLIASSNGITIKTNTSINKDGDIYVVFDVPSHWDRRACKNFIVQAFDNWDRDIQLPDRRTWKFGCFKGGFKSLVYQKYYTFGPSF